MGAPFQDGGPITLTAGTRKRLSSSSIRFDWLIITALAANTGAIYVGSSLIATGRGKTMLPGDEWPVPISEGEQVDISEVWGDTDTTNDKVAWIGGWGRPPRV